MNNPIVTIEAVKEVARQESVSVLEVLTEMQTDAVKLNDNEETLKAVTALKHQILSEMGIL